VTQCICDFIQTSYSNISEDVICRVIDCDGLSEMLTRRCVIPGRNEPIGHKYWWYTFKIPKWILYAPMFQPHTTPLETSYSTSTSQTTMSSAPTLASVYSEALARYEQLHREGKIKDWQLTLIQQQTDLNDVLSTVRDAEAKNEGERNAIDRLFHRVSPQIVTKIDRFSGVVDTVIQASELFPFPCRYCMSAV